MVIRAKPKPAVITRHKTVLFVGAFPQPASLERYVSGDLALHLKAAGWRVQVTSRSASKLGRLSEILWRVVRARVEYDLVCMDLFSGPAFLWAEAACAALRALRKPFVLTLHGGDLPAFARRHPARVKRLLDWAAAVTCPSPYLLQELGRFRPDTLLLPNGLDLARYRFRNPQPPLRRLLWLRAFHEIYNPLMAVEVFGRVRSQHREASLTMVGPDKGDGSLGCAKRVAENLDLKSVINFTGPVSKNDVPATLEQGDIFLNTTNFDNTPVSVLEALACGLPVVTTNVGGIPWLLKDQESGLLVPPNDVPAMARAVVRLMHDPALALRLACNGRKLVEPFDWGVVLPRWERLLESLLLDSTPALRKAERPAEAPAR
jgi:glycosyltransferase involved in cell wall biosynthesis